tara:strand:+ start:1131 stop:1487 length:357 start_codon:yes stop_codon:yes gene_type:complete
MDDKEYPDSVRIFPNNESQNSVIDVTVFMRVNGEEHRLRIYQNTRKLEGDNRPDYLVSLRLNGLDLEANSWRKEARETGKVYFQGTPKPKSVGYSSGNSNEQPKKEETKETFDDKIPF